MSILEQSKSLYEQRGRELIRSRFPEYEGRIAVGLAGHGSECFGFDDEVSLDHDCAPGFCLWLTDEDDASVGVELQRAYASLAPSAAVKGPGGLRIRGVMSIADFYRPYTGTDGAPREWRHWLSLPSYALAEATNGQVWRDELGSFSAVREQLLHGMPEDVRKKKLAALTMSMAQSGQYNYARCLEHGQQGAAMLALCAFVNAAVEAVYLLNRAHMPYYKWALRGMSALAVLSQLKEALEFLLCAENADAGRKLKAAVIEDICAQYVRQLRMQQLSDGTWDYLEPHAREITERIENSAIRSMHIME